MDWSKVGESIASYAPLLGGVVGGPAGSALGGVVASVFGVEPKPDLIMNAIKTDPEASVKLKAIELDNKVELQRLSIQIAESEIKDKQNARKENKHSRMPAILSVALSIVVVIIIYLLFYTPIPENSEDVLFMLLGLVLKEWGGAMQYWFGTTRSSANKDLNK